MEKKSIWQRSNALEALKANHASLIIITVLQTIVPFIIFFKISTLFNQPQPDGNFLMEWEGILQLSNFIITMSTGVLLLLLSHYHNRYGIAISFKDKNFYPYFGKFLKRTLLASLLVLLGWFILAFGAVLLMGLVSAFLVTILGKVGGVISALLSFIVFAAVLIFLFIFLMMIYPPLLGEGEDKSFKTAFKNTKAIYWRFNKETFLLYLVCIIVSLLVCGLVVGLVVLSYNNDLLLQFQGIIIFFSIYLFCYMSTLLAFITQTFASQYYFELQAKKQEALA